QRRRMPVPVPQGQRAVRDQLCRSRGQIYGAEGRNAAAAIARAGFALSSILHYMRTIFPCGAMWVTKGMTLNVRVSGALSEFVAGNVSETGAYDNVSEYVRD